MAENFVEKKDLNDFFTGQVTIEHEARRAANEITHDYVNQLLKYIHQNDPRFGSEPFKMGSAVQRLKVAEPNEFDFGVILNVPEQQWRRSCEPRYFRLVTVEENNGQIWYRDDGKDFHNSVPNNIQPVRSDVPLPAPKTGYTYITFDPSSYPLWRERTDMHYGDNLVPFLVKRCFRKLLVSAIRSLDLGNNIEISRKISGPAITIDIKDAELDDTINVDFAVTARVQMPFPSGVTWPRPDAQWPSRQKARDVQAKGVNLVPKKDYDWLISYAEPERELRINMDQDGGCRAKVHRIMKKVNEDFLSNENKPVLSSYHLKNVLFWECERFYDDQFWTQDLLAERFNAMLDRLVHHLQIKHLPSYFDPRVNLLKQENIGKYDKLLNTIAEFRKNPSDYLREMDD